MKLKWITYLSLCICLTCTAETNSDQAFALGNNAYQNEQYAEAIQHYEEALQSGHSFSLHYNLANAYFKHNAVGQALYHYRLAETIDPSDHDLRANIRFVKEAAQLPVKEKGLLDQFKSFLNPDQWTWLGTVSFWIGLLLVCLPPLFFKAGMLLKTSSAAAFLICITAAIGMLSWHLERHSAIILQEQTAARVAPTSQSEIKKYLNAGEEVRTVASYKHFIKLTDNDDNTYWVNRAQLGIIHNIPLAEAEDEHDAGAN